VATAVTAVRWGEGGRLTRGGGGTISLSTKKRDLGSSVREKEKKIVGVWRVGKRRGGEIRE